MESTQSSRDQAGNTGTRNVTYDLTAVLYHALQGVENCHIYTGDASGKEEHRRFFQQAAEAQKQLAEQAKTLLHDCLMQEVQGGSQQDGTTSAFGQQGMSAGGESGTMSGEIASTQTHSFDEAREDGSAFRFASGQTEGGSDQFAVGSEQDRQGSAALSPGLQAGGTPNGSDPGETNRAQPGQDQRQDQVTTGGGSTRSF